MTFTARFQFVTIDPETEEGTCAEGPVDATTVHEFADEVHRGLARAGGGQLPDSEIKRLWGVISSVHSASSLSVRVMGDVIVDIRGLTEDEWDEAVRDNEPDDDWVSSSLTFYNNNDGNEAALGLARVAEYVVGDPSARYISHDHVAGMFEFTDHLPRGAAVAADL